MPGDLTPTIPWGGIIAGGANIIGSGIDAISQNAANQQSRRYATYMYDRQRADALSDWNRQNQYNSPRSIMQRYKDAGLNPNLIYSQQTQSPSVRSSSPQSWRPEAIRSGIGESVTAGFQAQMMKTQMDTMRVAQEVNLVREKQILADTLLKASTQKLTDIKAGAAAFELGFQKSIVGVRSDTLSANLNLLNAKKDQVVTETFMTMHEDIRRTMLANATTKEKLMHVAVMVAEKALIEAKTGTEKESMGLTSDQRKQITQNINNLEKQGDLLRIEADLKRGELDMQYVKGLMPHLLFGVK